MTYFSSPETSYLNSVRFDVSALLFAVISISHSVVTLKKNCNIRTLDKIRFLVVCRDFVSNTTLIDCHERCCISIIKNVLNLFESFDHCGGLQS